MRRVLFGILALGLLAGVTTSVVFALNYEGEDFCSHAKAWPGGTYLGQMHPYHSEFYRGFAERRGWDPCVTWAMDQRNSAIRGLRELGYTVTAPGGGAPPVASSATSPVAPTGASWRGLTIAAEDRCAPYDSDDYPYSASVEPQIVAQQGGNIYGPYTGTYFASTGETDIEHIVARSEAHDSGLCAASAETRRAFAGDLLNLTLASPSVNRHQKGANDAAEWLPDHNQCWYADRVVQVRVKYGLTVDQAEADVLDGILSGCASTEMVFTSATPRETEPPNANALDLYDDNGNGRISCAEARAHGIAPVHQGHPAYEFMNDGDGDGVVCE